MPQTSVTGTDSFAARLLRSERGRIQLMAAALVVTLLGVCARRALGGVVMSVDSAFFPTIGVLLLGLVFQGIALLVVHRRARTGGAIPTWQRIISVAVDLAVPGAVLLILQLHSPRGVYASLSGPSLMLMPL